MSNPPRRVYAITLKKVHALMGSRGLAASDLLAGTELRESDLVDPYNLISEAQARMYYRNVVKLTDSDGLGLEIGSMSTISDLGPQGLTQLTARTIREALEGAYANRYVYHLLVDWKMEISGQRIVHRLSVREPDERLRIFLLERGLGILQAHGEELVGLAGSDLAPIRVLLDYKAPENFQRYKKIFRCPVLFDQDVVEISHSTAHYLDLDASLDTYDPQVRDVLGVTERKPAKETVRQGRYSE